MYAGPWHQGVSDPRICQSTKNNTKKNAKGQQKKKAIISPKGQVPVFWSRLAPATLYRRGRTGAEPVDIPTLDRAGPVKTGPCKLYGVPTG